ncbi:MAG: hypothetical protein PWR20_511 [Bacteroidales bacterium]|jgi:hypothetical protein|nr:hypothetical protein [Bacteroidales bacterium]MDN5328945.1 hypothetical protein [Bacteroidales bacterium]
MIWHSVILSSNKFVFKILFVNILLRNEKKFLIKCKNRNKYYIFVECFKNTLYPACNLLFVPLEYLPEFL